MTTDPAPRRTPTRPKQNAIRVEYVEVTGAAGEPLTIPYNAGGPQPPEVQVISVDQIEGTGMANFLNRWKLALIWR